MISTTIYCAPYFLNYWLQTKSKVKWTQLPRSMLEDVLITMRQFIFSIDFVVLEIKVVMSFKNEIPVIPSWPFLVTSNALINCSNWKMKFRLGNIKMKLNVFKLYKRPMGSDGMEYRTFDWVGNFLHGGVKFNHEEELISYVYESFVWSTSSNLIHLDLRNNVMIHCVHLFLCFFLLFPLHLMRPYLVHPHPPLLS